MITVIGGSGFIGTRLCRRLLEHGREFLIVDKERSTAFANKVRIADVRSIDQLRDAIPDGSIIVNLAAEHRDDVRPRSLYDEVNVHGAENVCQVARERNIDRIVFTSSVAIYGFARPNTDESGAINFFNDYGRTKWHAEEVFTRWQAEDPSCRTLAIVRPTVAFGEQNRGNVYNLLRQIASGKFMMIGNGENVKSMAYVENLAAFLEHSFSLGPGVHIFNYVDKPDFDMNGLVDLVRKKLGVGKGIGVRLPYSFGLMAGYVFDLFAWAFGKGFTVSSIRVRKFCAVTQFDTSVAKTGFVAPVSLSEGLERTLRHEFIEDHSTERVFVSE